MDNISQDDIDKLYKYADKPENNILFELGVGLQYEYAPSGVKYSAPYEEIGLKLWAALRYELQQLLCAGGKPKPIYVDISGGDKRELAVGILAAITSTFDVTLGIALPAAALVIKKQLKPFCAGEVEKPKQTVKEILSDKKDKMQP